MDKPLTMKKGGAEYTLTYNSGNHLSVLSQMHGSKWPEVLPYCLANVALMVVLQILKRNVLPEDFTLDVSKEGHAFLTFSISYLLVSRINTSLANYNKTRNQLTIMCRETRELVQASCVYSCTQKDRKAHEWREKIAYRVLMMLRTVMAVLDYAEFEQPAWKVPELQGEELEDVMRGVFIRDGFERWAHNKDRTTLEESMRVPLRMAYQCRKAIHAHTELLSEPMATPQENKMLDSVDSFLDGYFGLRTFLTTPTPFPLIQMTRTLLFLYMYSVPFVLLNDDSSAFAHCFVVFVLTFGFLGLEYCAMELDDPFGGDANDFDNDALARAAYEDAYLTIADMNGAEWADKLRQRMDPQVPPIEQEESNSWGEQASEITTDENGNAKVKQPSKSGRK